MVKRVQVTFSQGEYYLYDWLVNYARKTVKGRRWGISEVVKEALKLYMIAKTATRLDVFDLYFREYFIEEFLECEDCGSRMRVEDYYKEGDTVIFKLYCSGCATFGKKKLDLSKIRVLEDVAEHLMSEVEKTGEEKKEKSWKIKI
ncbi:MAG: hypothetical protein QXP96_04760 [Thermoproteota archaeon]